jgi:peptidoglycan/LPS O-acetylase OafA/YrhL
MELKKISLGVSFVCFLLLAITNLCQVEVLRLVRTIGIFRQIVHLDRLDATNNSFFEEKIKNANYVRLYFEFRVDGKEGNQNLFQTNDANSGIRAELSENSLGILFPSPGAPSNLKSINMAQGFGLGVWNEFYLDAASGAYVYANIKGYNSYLSWIDHPYFLIEHIRVDIGYDDLRRFHGDIRNIRLETGRARNVFVGTCILYLIKILFFAGYVLFLCKGLPKAAEVKINALDLKKYPPPRLYDPLLFLRAFACLMVLAGHGLMIIFRPVTLVDSLGSGGFQWILTSSPWGGVWIFFVLSGYLMGKGFITGRHSPDRGGVYRFFRNRILRIAPLYWVSVLLVSALDHPEIFYLKRLGTLLAILFFDNDGGFVINPIGALWSVCTEIQFYLLVPLLFVFVNRFMASAWALLFVLLLFISFGILFRVGVIDIFGWDLWPREVYKTLIGNIDLFVCGFLANYLIIHFKNKCVSLRHGLVAGGTVLIAMYFFLAFVSSKAMILEQSTWRAFFLQLGPTLVLVVTIVIITLFELGAQSSVPTMGGYLARKVEVFGLLTYAVYVWHEPVFHAFSRIQSRPYSELNASLIALASATAVTLLIGSIMYYLVELPFDRKKSYR